MSCHVLVSQSRLTLCDPRTVACQVSLSMGFFQARVLEWVAISFSRGSSQPRDRTQVSRITGSFFTIWVTREVLKSVDTQRSWYSLPKILQFLCLKGRHPNSLAWLWVSSFFSFFPPWLLCSGHVVLFPLLTHPVFFKASFLTRDCPFFADLQI